MATQTQHFNLTKPDWEDRASISVLNANTDIIDAQMYDNEQSAANAIGNMAAEYDDTATYEVGDFCIYSEVLYKCVTAVTVAEAFDSTKWTQTTAAENFGSGGGGSATLAGLNDVNLTSPTDGQALVYDATNQEWVNGAGGGGNANERVLTKAEYNALTEAQKMDGTTYYINDAVPEGKEIQPVIYSLEEREVGVWTDGKPLYQKTYTIDASTLVVTSGWKDIDNTLNAERMIWQEISVKDKGYGESRAIFLKNDNNTVPRFQILDSTGAFSYYTNTTSFPFNDYVWCITIRYTKTTDQPGSGIYTPQGQLAVHYSTDEHVIGTWIDGKTLYEKVFTGLSVALNDISWVNLVTIQDVEFCLSVNAYRTQNPSYAKIPIAECDVNNGNIRVSTVSSQFNTTINMAIVQYTKTTD